MLSFSMLQLIIDLTFIPYRFGILEFGFNDRAKRYNYEIENGNYDLVFAGSYGKSDLKKVVMGSTAEKVMRRSPIYVFVTRR